MAVLATQAHARGYVPPTVASLQYSLAIPVEPLWPGTRAATTAEVGALVRMGFAFLAWSSQARGFFAYGDNQRPRDPLARLFDTPANRGRRERARALAKKLGVSTSVVALAYLFGFPGVRPIIGPKKLAELDAAIAATSVVLEPRQRDALRGGETP